MAPLGQDVHMPQRPRRHFTPEQKADAVRLVHEVGNMAQVARDLDLNRHVLKRWVANSSAPRRKPSASPPEESSAPLTKDERKELHRLRRENKRLEQEREFLKKAAAFFAKSPGRPAS
jgi:transposase